MQGTGNYSVRAVIAVLAGKGRVAPESGSMRWRPRRTAAPYCPVPCIADVERKRAGSAAILFLSPARARHWRRRHLSRGLSAEVALTLGGVEAADALIMTMAPRCRIRQACSRLSRRDRDPALGRAGGERRRPRGRDYVGNLRPQAWPHSHEARRRVRGELAGRRRLRRPARARAGGGPRRCPTRTRIGSCCVRVYGSCVEPPRRRCRRHQGAPRCAAAFTHRHAL